MANTLPSSPVSSLPSSPMSGNKDKDKLTGQQAFNQITTAGITTMINCSRYNTNVYDVAKIIMILVYSEKENNSFKHFKDRIEKEGPAKIL